LFYRFGLHGGTEVVDLYRVSGGSWVFLAGMPFAPAKDRWYTLTVEVVGDSIRGFVNGELLIDTHDATHPTGGIGIGVLEDAMVTVYDDVVVQGL